MRARNRPRVRIGVRPVGCLSAAALIAALLAACGQGSSPSGGAAGGRGATQVVYRLQDPISAAGTGAASAQLLTAMRGRLADAGLVVTKSSLGGRRLELTLAGIHVGRGDRARLADLGDPGRLVIYDWEPNVIGPGGRPNPLSTPVTGGPDAGDPQFGLSLYGAVIRASLRPAIRRPSETAGRRYYLVDDHAHRVIRGPAARPRDLLAGGLPSGSRTVGVRPGTVIVAAERPEDVPRPKEDRYYVLNDDPALTSADVLDPGAGTDTGVGQTGQPDLSFDLTDRGVRLFDALTRTVAHRGETVPRTGISAPESYQHYAVVIDDRLISVPAVDYVQYPDGLSGAAGVRVVGGFTDATAETLASLLRYRPLPVALALESVRNPAAVRKPVAAVRNPAAAGSGPASHGR